jgi:hypothetical protein
MPEMGKDVAAILRLYKLCRQNRALPYPGGVLDQPAWLMSAFDAIDAAKDSFLQEQQEHQDAAVVIAGMQADGRH